MLEKLRRLIEPLFQSLALYFSSTNLSPNFWTTVSFLLSIAAGICFSTSAWVINFPLYYISLIAGILLLGSGFFDLIDGAVARVSKKY
jgi:archaetidylinositol phosphate synthase